MHFHTYLWIFRNVCVWIFLILLLHIMCINYTFLRCVFVFYGNTSWKSCQYARTSHILITKACFYIVWLHHVIVYLFILSWSRGLKKFYFLVHGILLSLVFAGPFLVGFDLSTFHPDFWDDTGLVLLELSRHGIGNDPSRTFRSKNIAHINQCPVTFLSIFGTQHSALSCHFPTRGQNYLLIPQVFLRVST